MNDTKRRVLTIIGGGVWVVSFIQQLAARIASPQLDIRLAAQDQNKLRIIDACCQRLIKSRSGWKILATSPDAAIDGTDICVLLLRVGGWAARSLDEKFPSRFRALGDEGLGLGGYANALRTIPVLATLAENLTARSPSAIVLNLVAPLGLTTRTLLDRGVRAIGLCELPVTTERALLRTLQNSENGPSLDYTGLNHLGWFWPRDADLSIFEEAVALKLVDRLTLDRYGAIPLYYYYKIFDTMAGRRIGLKFSPGRAEELKAISMMALSEMASGASIIPALSGRKMPWYEDCITPVLEALIDGGIWSGFLNARVPGGIPWGDAATVIEVRGTICQNLTWTEPPPTPRSDTLQDFLSSIARAESLIYQAALGGGEGSIRAAIEEGLLDIPQGSEVAAAQAVHDAGTRVFER